MSVETNDNFTRLVDYLKAQGIEAKRRTEDTQEYRDFLAAYPQERLSQLTLDEYCVGKGDNASFCWWIERGLVPALGRYMPGTAKGHILYFQPDGSLYKHRHLADLSDEEALRYTLKIQSTIAAAEQANSGDLNGDLSWVDDDKLIYQRAGVEPRVTVGEGRKLRLLSCYYPSRTLPISSSDHLGHYLRKLGCPEQDIPRSNQPVARMLKLREYYRLACESVPDLSPYGFMRGLYNDELGLAPVKEQSTSDDEESLSVFVPIHLGHGDRVDWNKATHVRLTGLSADTPKAQESLDFIASHADDSGIAATADLEAAFPGRQRSQMGQQGAMRFDLRHFANSRDSGNNPQDKGLLELGYMDKNVGSHEAPLAVQYRAPLNQILYGPPGTGKTYETIDAALEVLAPQVLSLSREQRKQRFDEFVAQKRIRFVTFHQSFSYEDFVEGLRAVNNDEQQLEYRVEPGVFKRLCDDARTQGGKQDSLIRSNPRLWKISINGTWGSPELEYCLKHGEARIGWGNTGDLREPLENNSYYQSLGSGDQGTLGYFANEVVPGDIFVCIHSAEQMSAIGVVTGDYRYDDTPPPGVRHDYKHVRAVRWLYRDLQLSVLPLNDNRSFTQKTVYALDRFSWGDLLAYVEKSGAQPIEQVIAGDNDRKPYVLIIDEINRGNVSRIFGELITLIEPSKREGAEEALSTELPYSKRPFSVPDNVYLIGTMNTADRSLAGLDIALRRRFTFREMPPRPDELKGVMVEGISLEALLHVMNQRIEILLDRDHCLGHAYFMDMKIDASKRTLAQLALIFRQKILPLLQEYFFEDWERIGWVLNDQHAASNGCQPFIRQPASEESLVELFGSKVAEGLSDRRWELNDSAFDSIDSYRNILGNVG